MFKHSLNKAVIVLVLVVVGAGLTSLGMRLPALPGLSAPLKPKPQPRAVLKNQVSTCKGQLNKAAQPKLAIQGTFITLAGSAPLPTVSTLLPESAVFMQFASPGSPRSPPIVS
jgi:hypothetical protein